MGEQQCGARITAPTSTRPCRSPSARSRWRAGRLGPAQWRSCGLRQRSQVHKGQLTHGVWDDADAAADLAGGPLMFCVVAGAREGTAWPVDYS